jgi:hypothetical protein
MTPQELASLRREQQAMLANVDEIEQAYRDRPAELPADPELEQWISNTRQAVAEQQDWLIALQADQLERQSDKRKAVIGIIVLLIALIGVILFS